MRARWTFAAAVLFAQGALALPDATWLVSVGNDHGDLGEVGLLYAERDAREMVDAFRQHGGVSGARTTVLLGENADTVRRALQDVNARIRAHSASGTALIVFYSGHADAAALHLGGTRFELDELKALVAGSPAAMRLLVVDACRSGTVTRVKGVQDAESFEIELNDTVAAEGMAIITSSAAGESSQESDALRGSFFSHHFVNAMRGAADRNDDGQVTLGEAYEYTYAQTLRSSGRTLALQHPTYAIDVKGKGELVLARPREASGRAGRLKLGGEAVYLISEKREGGPVFAEVSPAAAGATLALPAGDYFVQERRPSEYREYQVTIGAGGEAALASLPYRAVRYDRLVRRRGGGEDRAQGLFALSAVRGEVVAGEGLTPQLLLGYAMDLPYFTVGARLRGATTVAGSGLDPLLPRRHDEVGLGLALQRFVDFDQFSIAFGVVAEAVWHRQVFDGDRSAPDRNALGGSFGGVLSIERHLFEGLAVRFEGGPVTMLFRQAQIDHGTEAPPDPNRPEPAVVLATPFTWWAAGGVVWRL